MIHGGNKLLALQWAHLVLVYTQLYIFFTYYQRTSLPPTFKNNLALYACYIHDIFLVWTGTQQSFQKFTSSNQCKLTWKTEKLSSSANFLDLTVILNRKSGKFNARTYQKDMNLFLYIPALSSHPPGLLKSIIYGLLENYWRQNSHSRDYIKFSQLLHKRLLARGRDLATINALFTKAAARIDLKTFNTATPAKTKSLTRESIFFHYEFHTRYILRQFIQDTYESTCETVDETGLSFNNMENASGDKLSIKKSQFVIHDLKIYATTWYHQHFMKLKKSMSKIC